MSEDKRADLQSPFRERACNDVRLILDIDRGLPKAYNSKKVTNNEGDVGSGGKPF
jgi:hypothetical protein